MKLLFSLIPTPAPDGAEKLVAAAERAAAGAAAHFDGRVLEVSLPAGVDAVSAERAIVFELSTLGVTATPIYNPDPVVFPSFEPRRQGRTVRLSVFITSLLAAVLATVLISFVAAFARALVFCQSAEPNLFSATLQSSRGPMYLSTKSSCVTGT